jgi:hypothetical protein
LNLSVSRTLLFCSSLLLLWGCGGDDKGLGSNDPFATYSSSITIDPFLSSAVIDPGLSSGIVDPGLSSPIIDPGLSSGVVDPGLSSPIIDPGLSSGIIDPGLSSAIIDPGLSSATDPIVSSSSTISGPGIPVEAYPVANYGVILSNGKTGWSSRYWDACKPHCSWISNGAEGQTDTTTEASYQANLTTTRNCNIKDIEIPTFTLSRGFSEYWTGWEGTESACKSGKGGAFTCTDMAPVKVNDTLSYGFVAGPGSSTTCGKCFHLQFNGSFHDAGEHNAPKATHKALKGKHMVVMTSNIGHDVKEGQFDLMVPGGGVGQFDALSTMVNGSGVQWGAQYGGFLTQCQQSLGYDNTLESYQNCVKDMCDAAFTGYDNLLRGCHWYADWYMAADNPTYNWEEVECPQYLVDRYKTTINTTRRNIYAYQTDWSTYEGGEIPTDTRFPVDLE